MDPRGIRAGVTALVAVAGLALSGCGIIGDPLAAGPKKSPSSSASPSPVLAVPRAGDCYDLSYVEQYSPVNREPVDCASSHYSEIVYVGQFTGAEAKLAAPPVLSTEAGPAFGAQRDAYATCVEQSTRYLNHPWYDPNLALRVGLPTFEDWWAGARWYTCELYEHSWDVDVEAIDLRRKDSLKARWMKTVCVDQNTARWPTVACTQKHPGEFVGGFQLPAKLTKEPKTRKEWDVLFEKCYRLAAIYRGVASSKARQLSSVSVWWIDGPYLWPSGRRSALCFTWTGAQKSSYVTGSVKGAQSANG